MWARALVFLLGAVFIYQQVFAVDTAIYIAELMVESNVTLEASTILSALNATGDLTVAEKTVTIVQSELTAECLVIGDESTCNCSAGHIWSNEVCYDAGCCTGSPCKQNVSHYTPLCIAKVKVRINGSVQLRGGTWEDASKQKLLRVFQALNGFEGLNVTGNRESGTVADFEAGVSVIFPTNRLQGNVIALEQTLGATIHIETTGMVDIEVPDGDVCYRSKQILKCTFSEATGSSGWNMTRRNERFELNTGSTVKLSNACVTPELRSCTEVTLNEVTGNWAGTYECGFTSGPIRHTAKASLAVALLPDDITITVQPLTVECSTETSEVLVQVEAVIQKSTENYTFTWHYRQTLLPTPRPSSSEGLLSYTNRVSLSCIKTTEAQNVSITFKNRMGQTKHGEVSIPVIYDVEVEPPVWYGENDDCCETVTYPCSVAYYMSFGQKFCEEYPENGTLWPKTPNGETVIHRTCDPGRVGHKERTCENAQWQPVFSSCVDEQLSKVLDAADNFLQGLGATQEVAMSIFEGLKNSSTSSSDSDTGNMADLGAAISILSTMAEASGNIVLGESVLPNFLNAASNMLNISWDRVNRSIENSMSSKYLKSVEDLVKNINFNTSDGFQTQNLDLKICQSLNDPEFLKNSQSRNNLEYQNNSEYLNNSESRNMSLCKRTVFGIGVNLNVTSGIVKAMAVKNLAEKLNNSCTAGTPRLLVSATLKLSEVTDIPVDIDIILDFPLSREPQAHGDVLCVFWNVSADQWSRDGCEWITDDAGNRTLCRCNHLTSFSALMSKMDINLPFLDEITYVGLGVSICSLLLFLIAEALVWSAVVKTNLSHFRHTALVNISLCLFLADCSFLASSYPEILGDTGCLVLTVCKHFFFLASFGWMLSLSVMLVHQLVFVFSPLRKRVFMFFSTILGYVCPTVIVGSSYVYYRFIGEDYHDEKCWLIYKGLLNGSMYAFLLPIGIVVLTNLFCMGVVILTLVKSAVPEASKAEDKSTAKSILKVVIFLTPVFGVTWILGFFQLMLDNGGGQQKEPMTVVVIYAFTILNSFQGFFIFLIGCFAEQKVRQEVFKLIVARAPSKGRRESMKNLTSTSLKKHG